MRTADIKRIERALGFDLPDAYQKLLLDFPLNLADAFPDGVSPDERRLFNTPDPIINTNTLVRASDYLIDPDDPDSQWPDEYLIIGMDIGCNFYCLNRTLKRSSVFFWFHEDGVFEKHAKSLNDFVKQLVGVYSNR